MQLAHCAVMHGTPWEPATRSASADFCCCSASYLSGTACGPPAIQTLEVSPRRHWGGGWGADSPLAAFCWPHESGPVEHTPWFYTASLDVTWPPIAALCMAGMSPLWDLIAHPSYVVDTLLFEHHNVSASICISQSRAGAAVTIWNHCGVPQLMKLPRPRKPNEGSLHPLASPQLVWRCFPSSQAGPPSLARPQPAQKKPESTT